MNRPAISMKPPATAVVEMLFERLDETGATLVLITHDAGAGAKNATASSR